MRQRVVAGAVWMAIAVVLIGVMWLLAMGPPANTPRSGTVQVPRDASGAPDPSKEGSLDSSGADQTDGQQAEAVQLDETLPSSSGQQGDAFPISQDTSCPVGLPGPHAPVSYKRGVNIETWNTLAQASCQEYARDVLLSLYDAGATLVEADYLDLFGKHWGCVVQSDDDRSITVTIKTLPQDQGEGPLLDVTVIRILPPVDLLEDEQP